MDPDLFNSHSCSSEDSYSLEEKSNEYASPLNLSGEKREQSIFTIGRYLKKGGAPKDLTEQVLSIIGENCTPPFPIPELKGKIDKAYAGQDNQEKGLTQEIREWVLTTTDHFLTTDVYNEMGLTTRDNKKKAVVILGRLVDEGLIERGAKRGQFRVINRSEEIINWREAEAGEGLPIRWPLELENRFEVMPGSVVVVAGESNSGKTAWMLATARLNLEKFRTYYFASSNEVNARTLRKRLELFNEPLEVWDRLTPISRANDFQDVIRPNDLNLVDYLEVHQDFYEIGGMLAAISQKLRDGVAVVALQKNPGADFGRGGAMTMEKASAYLSLHRGDLGKDEPHALKLPKIKYPLVDFATKPIRFKLAGGCRFIRA